MRDTIADAIAEGLDEHEHHLDHEAHGSSDRGRGSQSHRGPRRPPARGDHVDLEHVGLDEVACLVHVVVVRVVVVLLHFRFYHGCWRRR